MLRIGAGAHKAEPESIPIRPKPNEYRPHNVTKPHRKKEWVETTMAPIQSL